LAHSRPKLVEKRNKHIKKYYAPSWLYLQDDTGTDGQQNIKCSHRIYEFGYWSGSGKGIIFG